jgi:U3 small nucleolar RNA-associated protein 22
MAEKKLKLSPKFNEDNIRPALSGPNSAMAPLPSKRRKLDHDSEGASSAEESVSGDNEDYEQAASESADEAPVVQLKQTQTRPKRVYEDNAAIYAGGDYKSSLFKLQVDELLAGIKPNYGKRLGGVDEALHTLKGLIESIKDRDGLPVRDNASLCFTKI